MSQRLHATTVAIGGRGVMIVGASGAGKSDLALRLIDRGAVLISDDYTVVEANNGSVVASAPVTTRGKMEVRGIGIVTISFAECADVALIVRLGGEIERMPEPAFTVVAGCSLPILALDAREASAPIKVEIALARLVEARA